MGQWIAYAAGAAILYGLHQVFTRLAADHVGPRLGGLIVELTAAGAIAGYIALLVGSGNWKETATARGVFYSGLTGLCVAGGTVLFFELFQAGGPLSAVPLVLAGGGAIMAIAGMVLLGEPADPLRIFGILLALCGIVLFTND
jgi:bacterial/archaeal transporter family protein